MSPALNVGDASAQECLQTVDQRDALGVERAAVVAFGTALASREPSAATSFVPVRTSLNLVPDRPSTDSYSSSAAFCGKRRRLVEDDRDGQVGIHAKFGLSL